MNSPRLEQDLLSPESAASPETSAAPVTEVASGTPGLPRVPEAVRSAIEDLSVLESGELESAELEAGVLGAALAGTPLEGITGLLGPAERALLADDALDQTGEGLMTAASGPVPAVEPALAEPDPAERLRQVTRRISVRLGRTIRLSLEGEADPLAALLGAEQWADLLEELHQRREREQRGLGELGREAERLSATLAGLQARREALDQELRRQAASGADQRFSRLWDALERSGLAGVTGLPARPLDGPAPWTERQLPHALLYVSWQLGRAWGVDLADSRAAEQVMERTLLMYLALAQGRMALLQGEPGSGKTTLALGFATSVGMKVHRVEVSKSWTDPSEVIGAVEPRASGATFVTGPLGQALIDAARTGGEQVAMVLLDELNMMTPEHGLSSVMSVMTEDGPRLLQACSPEDAEALPAAHLLHQLRGVLPWPRSVLLGATVNDARQDASIVPISDRLRDRCAVFELMAREISDDSGLSLLRRIQFGPRPPSPERPLVPEVWAAWTDPRRAGAGPEDLSWAAAELRALLQRLESLEFSTLLASNRAAQDALLIFALAYSALAQLQLAGLAGRGLTGALAALEDGQVAGEWRLPAAPQDAESGQPDLRLQVPVMRSRLLRDQAMALALELTVMPRLVEGLRTRTPGPLAQAELDELVAMLELGPLSAARLTRLGRA